MAFPSQTRFAKLPPKISYALILAVMAVMAYGLFISEAINHNHKPTRGADLECQRAIVERIQNGEGYYQSAQKELRERGYATQSVFNWRLPFLALFLASLPKIEIGYGLGILLAAFALFLWVRILRKEMPFRKTLFGTLLFAGILIYGGIPGLYFAHEFWAGTFIVLSLIFYSRGRFLLSYLAGGAALLVRELSLCFVIVMMISALWERRWREGLVWLSLTIGFLLVLGIHAHSVQRFMDPAHFIQNNGWVAFGGWAFALKTMKMHPFLMVIPSWAHAILAPLLLLGLAGWKGKLGTRAALSVYAYILSFLFVGQPFNIYWGTMYNSIVPLGFLFILPSLKDLWGSISKKTALQPLSPV